MMDIKEQMGCDHEPDPATVEYDDHHGRQAVCRKCGAKLVMSRYFLRAGESKSSAKRLTSKEKREMARKGHRPQSVFGDLSQKMEQDGAGDERVAITKGISVPPSTAKKGAQ